MKNLVKALALVLALVMVFAMASCSNKEEPLAGGMTEKDEEITPELQEIFDNAMEGFDGVGYKAVKLVGTQVVAGTNYKFLAEATTMTNPPTTTQKYITVYKDLEGNCSILEITDVE